MIAEKSPEFSRCVIDTPRAYEIRWTEARSARCPSQETTVCQFPEAS
jgi:hypothetical protein